MNAHRSFPFAPLRASAHCAQDDTTPRCHPERSEGSLADFWGITRSSVSTIALISFKIATHYSAESWKEPSYGRTSSSISLVSHRSRLTFTTACDRLAWSGTRSAPVCIAQRVPQRRWPRRSAPAASQPLARQKPGRDTPASGHSHFQWERTRQQSALSGQNAWAL